MMIKLMRFIPARLLPVLTLALSLLVFSTITRVVLLIRPEGMFGSRKF